MLVAPTLARFAIKFGPAEYFSLMVLGLTILTYLSHGSMAKALLMACVGLVLGLIGLDSITAQPRLTFDRIELLDGVGLVPVVMGLFGIAEVLSNIERRAQARDDRAAHQRAVADARADWTRKRRADAARLGARLLPRHPAGRRRGDRLVRLLRAREALSKTPERFGKGAIEGVAGPEAANNAAAGGAFIPLLTLGIPPNVVMALLLGAFIIHGLQPGPAADEPEARTSSGASSPACTSATSCCWS